MKKKMINLFLIIISLGSLFLAFGWQEYHKKNSAPDMERTITLATSSAPSTMTQFLRTKF